MNIMQFNAREGQMMTISMEKVITTNETTGSVVSILLIPQPLGEELDGQ